MSVVLVLALTVLAAQTARATEVYQIDPTHSSVTFKIRHLVSNVTGRFDDFAGTITVDRDDLTKSSVEFTIQATSIDTDNENRDQHLRSADFFDVEKYPTITFKSSKIEKTGDDAYNVTGDFTMHGTTKSIVLPVSVLGFAPGMRGGTVAGFETSTKINRKDYGVLWNRALDAGGLVLGDDVQVNISIESGYKPAE
jgi:polyisoprenoid-binding protein YceI